jgi:hypothetical protein
VRFSSPAALNTLPKMALPWSPTTCRLGAEGIVSKKVDGAYLSGPCRVWIKVRNPASVASSGSAARFGTSDLSQFAWPTTRLAIRTRVGGTRRPPDAPAARAPRA